MGVEVDILGTKYSVIKSDKFADSKLENLAGYCDSSVNQIVIDTFKTDNLSKSNLMEYEKEVVRHELIHAFCMNQDLIRAAGQILKK